MKSRAKIFTYFGPFFVISFMIPWFPWRSGQNSPPYLEGIHLIVSLFFYDAFFRSIRILNLRLIKIYFEVASVLHGLLYIRIRLGTIGNA
jgi:hypothetical protein